LERPFEPERRIINSLLENSTLPPGKVRVLHGE